MSKENVINRTALLSAALAVVFLGAGCGQKTAAPDASTPPTGASATGAASSESAAVVGSGDCDHPYYPLRNGYEIAYRTDSAGRTSDYVMTQSDVTGSSAKLTISFTYPKEFSVVQNLSCDDGTIGTDGYLDVGGAMDGTVKTRTKGVSGDLMPKNLAVGTEWDTTYEMAIEYEGMSIPGFSGEATGTTVSKSRVVAREQVEVPAGKFDALKVEVETTSTMTMPGLPTQPPTTSVSYEWWVKGVGLVKMMDADGATSTVATRISGR